MSNKNKDTMTVVVNGVPTEVTFNKNAPLHTIVPEALRETGNSGPPERWEIKDQAGNLLDGNKKIEDFKFPDNVTLFLSLKAGVGG